MPRVKGGNKNLFKHKKVILLSKGFRGRRKNVYIISKQAILKSLKFSYIDRKLKKRFLKSFWIFHINFFLKKYNLNYSKFKFYIKKINLSFNLKILFNLMLYDEKFFLIILRKCFLFFNNGY